MDPSQLAQAKQNATHHGYFRRVLLGLDLFANVLAFGKVGETISARSQRAADRGNWAGKAMTGFLHLFQKNHGVLAEIGDEARAQEVEAIEQNALGK